MQCHKLYFFIKLNEACVSMMCWQCWEQSLPSSLISFTRRPNTRTVIGWGELVTIPEHLVGYGAVLSGSDNHNHNQPPLQCSILRISLTLFEILFWKFVNFYNVWTTVVWLVETRSEWRPMDAGPYLQPRTKLSTLSSFGPRCDKRTDRPACGDSHGGGGVLIWNTASC